MKTRSMLLAGSLALVFLLTPHLTGAANTACKGCLDSIHIPKSSTGDVIKSIINIIGFLAGVLSVAFIALGGIRYASSEGDSAKLTQAKQTITYAIIGLILSVLAPVIVGFALGRAGL